MTDTRDDKRSAALADARTAIAAFRAINAAQTALAAACAAAQTARNAYYVAMSSLGAGVDSAGDTAGQAVVADAQRTRDAAQATLAEACKVYSDAYAAFDVIMKTEKTI